MAKLKTKKIEKKQYTLKFSEDEGKYLRDLMGQCCAGHNTPGKHLFKLFYNTFPSGTFRLDYEGKPPQTSRR